MNRSTSKMRAVAVRLLAFETVENKPSKTTGPAVFGGVIEKLRRPLVALTGAAGFRSLLSRALALANNEIRWLQTVRLKADGSLECPADMTRLESEEIAKGEITLITQLLELLVTFIGEALTLRLLQDVWPAAPIDNLDASKEKK
jgi:hypothetical protein